MFSHRVLIRRLIPQIDAPSDMVGIVGGGHVDAAVVEEDRSARFNGQRDGRDLLVLRQGGIFDVHLGVGSSRMALVVVFDELGVMGPRPDLQTTVDLVRVH